MDLYGKKKPIGSVTYENERISIKKQLTLLGLPVVLRKVEFYLNHGFKQLLEWTSRVSFKCF